MILQETNSELILTGVLHRLTAVRHDPGMPFREPVELRDWAVTLDVTLGGALLDENDRLALARWLLVGTWHTVVTEVHE